MLTPSSYLGAVIRHSLNRTQQLSSKVARSWTFGLLDTISGLGQTNTMRLYERQKLAIFNKVNLFHIVLGLLIMLGCLLGKPRLSLYMYIVLHLPVIVSGIVLWMNRRQWYQTALLSYFLLMPLVTSYIYLSGMDFGLELNFILFGILAVFFLSDIGQMLFSIGFSMVSYFVLSVLWQDYSFHLVLVAPGLFLFIQTVLILMIFYGLFLIRNEHTQYQHRILGKHRELKSKNLEIERINMELAMKATQLEEQTRALQELHTLKNKLFSIIAHDLRTPMHALRNIFDYMSKNKMPAREIKAFIPDVVSDINNTTELMDNLLHWAKSQMGGVNVQPGEINISELTDEILRLHHPQAKNKQINFTSTILPGIFASGDIDMIKLVFRNLVSNAVKYTSRGGSITIEAAETDAEVEIFVRDTGIGMDAETLDRINEGNFFTSNGTSNESGTGLGLMLSREFIEKNGGQLNVVSQPGVGSVFSFTLVKTESMSEAV